MYEQDSKIAIGKAVPGDPPTMGSVTALVMLRIRSSLTKQTVFPLFKLPLGAHSL
jgi:hypothetical protein